MARGRRIAADAELDVIPVMSLIVHLIPMLLLSVRFVSLARLDTRGPVIPTTPAPSREAFARQADEVVSVRITGDGFVVAGDGAADPRIPCKGACGADSYDYAALTRAMVDAKTLHPEEQRVVLAPDGAISYEVLVRTMAATRADGKTVLFPSPILAKAEASR